MTPDMVLRAVGPGVLVTAVVLFALCRPWRAGSTPRPGWVGALAMAAAFIVADRLTWQNWPGVWPDVEHRRLPLVAVLAFGVAVADWVTRGKVAGTWLAWIAGAVLLGPVAFPMVASGQPPAILQFALFAGAVALLWGEAAATDRRVGGIRTPLILCLAAAGATLTIIQSRWLSGGLLMASLSAGMGVVAAISLWRPRIGVAGGAAIVYAAMLVGLVLCSEGTQLYSTIFTILSAATAGLGDRGPLAKLKPWMATVVCAILTLALAAAAIYYTPGGFDFGES